MCRTYIRHLTRRPGLLQGPPAGLSGPLASLSEKKMANISLTPGRAARDHETINRYNETDAVNLLASVSVRLRLAALTVVCSLGRTLSLSSLSSLSVPPPSVPPSLNFVLRPYWWSKSNCSAAYFREAARIAPAVSRSNWHKPHTETVFFEIKRFEN